MSDAMSAPGALQSFQRAFAAALRDDAAEPAASPWVEQPGFSVYRNTVRRACIDARRRLMANNDGEEGRR